MSLDWNMKKVKEGVAWKKGSNDKDGWHLTGTAESFIWLTILIGMNEITEKNCEEFFNRASFYEAVNGPFRRSSKGKILFTLDEVKAMVGMWTNASCLTKNQFTSRTYKNFTWDNNRKKGA